MSALRDAALLILRRCVADMAKAAPAIDETSLLDYAKDVEAITIRMRSEADAARDAALESEAAR